MCNNIFIEKKTKKQKKTMVKTFKIGLGGLGATWALVALNAPILSKIMNIEGELCFW